MINRESIYKSFFAGQNAANPITINDLRAREVRNERLSEEQSQALVNFDKFRLSELNKVETDADFNARFCELQIMANLTDYREFLKEEYFFSELL